MGQHIIASRRCVERLRIKVSTAARAFLSGAHVSVIKLKCDVSVIQCKCNYLCHYTYAHLFVKPVLAMALLRALSMHFLYILCDFVKQPIVLAMFPSSAFKALRPPYRLLVVAAGVIALITLIALAASIQVMSCCM